MIDGSSSYAGEQGINPAKRREAKRFFEAASNLYFPKKSGNQLNRNPSPNRLVKYQLPGSLHLE
jgi:hypothetical protein